MWPLLNKLQRDIFSAPDATFAARAVIAQGVPIEMEGWMPQEFAPCFEHALKRVTKTEGRSVSEPVCVIEVGSWKGLSANRMAQICKTQRGLTSKIICIDTWLGSPEHMEGESAAFGMHRVNGVPNLLTTFAKNTLAAGNDDVVFPFPISSAQGAVYLANHGMKADIIYIDAGHEYESVLLDLTLFWKLLKPGGVMIMDDYRWPGVRRAIDEFFVTSTVSGGILQVGYMQALAFKPLVPREQEEHA